MIIDIIFFLVRYRNGLTILEAGSVRRGSGIVLASVSHVENGNQSST